MRAATILAGIACLSVPLAGWNLWRLEQLAAQPAPPPPTSDAAVLARLEALERRLEEWAARPVPPAPASIDAAALAEQLAEQFRQRMGGFGGMAGGGGMPGGERGRPPTPEPTELAANIAQERGLDAEAQGKLAAVLGEQRTAMEALRERLRRGELGEDPRQAFEKLREETAAKLATVLPADQVEAVMERLRPSRRGPGGPGGERGGGPPAPPAATGAGQF